MPCSRTLRWWQEVKQENEEKEDKRTQTQLKENGWARKVRYVFHHSLTHTHTSAARMKIEKESGRWTHHPVKHNNGSNNTTAAAAAVVEASSAARTTTTTTENVYYAIKWIRNLITAPQIAHRNSRRKILIFVTPFLYFRIGFFSLSLYSSNLPSSARRCFLFRLILRMIGKCVECARACVRVCVCRCFRTHFCYSVSLLAVNIVIRRDTRTDTQQHTHIYIFRMRRIFSFHRVWFSYMMRTLQSIWCHSWALLPLSATYFIKFIFMEWMLSPLPSLVPFSFFFFLFLFSRRLTTLILAVDVLQCSWIYSTDPRQHRKFLGNMKMANCRTFLKAWSHQIPLHMCRVCR